MKKIVQFFKDSYLELRKVTWPGRDQVLSSTKVVIISVILIGLILGFLDFAFMLGRDLLFIK